MSPSYDVPVPAQGPRLRGWRAWAAALPVALGASCGGSPPITIESSSLQTCQLTVTGVTGTTVALDFQGLPANRAKTYGDFVAIWQATAVPWSVSPLARDTLPVDGESGSFVMTGLSVTSADYIVLYGVGDGITPACATVAIPHTGAGDAGAPSVPVSLQLTSVSEGSLTLLYRTFVGYLPMTYGNWVGLWQGDASPYNAPAPLGQAALASNASEGTVSLSGLHISPDTTYTLIYFTGTKLTEAAALLLFHTSAAQ